MLYRTVPKAHALKAFKSPEKNDVSYDILLSNGVSEFYFTTVAPLLLKERVMVTHYLRQ